MNMGKSMLAAAVICGTLITVCSQFDFIFSHYGRDYVVRNDAYRHLSRVLGTAIAPSRYRLLTTGLQEAFLQFSPIRSASSYEINSFIFRLLQNAALLLVAWAYFRSFGIGAAASALGLGILVYGMNAAFWQSDLSCYTYTQLVLLLLAGWLINSTRPGMEIWILPLTLLGALNREETVFFPVMLLAARASAAWPWLPHRRTLVIAVASLVLFFALYAAIHHFVGPAPYSRGRYGVPPGLHNLYFNITNGRTWLGLAQMYSLLPFTLLFWKYWPAVLRRYLLVVGLPWIGAEFVFGAADETRLFLGPLALIFIPAALAVISGPRTALQVNPPGSG